MSVSRAVEWGVLLGMRKVETVEQMPDEYRQVLLKLLGAGNQSPALAHRFANGFDNPVDYFDWFMFPDKAEAYLAQVA